MGRLHRFSGNDSRHARHVWLGACFFLGTLLLIKAVSGILPLVGTSGSRPQIHRVNPAPPPSAAGDGRNDWIARNIEDIRVGDWVMARDPDTGRIEPRRVTRVFRRVVGHLRLVTLRASASEAHQKLRTTDEHPFWVEGMGWHPARDLSPGHKVLQADGQHAVVVSNVRELHPQGVPVYNFEVEGFHTYFVAARGARAPPVWVHNSCDPGSNPPTEEFAETIRRFQRNPDEWDMVSSHSERSTRRGGRNRGVSTQSKYRNRETGETIWHHQVTDDRGRVVDDHFRPYYRAREGDLDD